MPITTTRHLIGVFVFTGLALFGTNSAKSAAGTAIVGQAVTFSVTSDGTTPFTYQWCKNSANIAGATGTSYAISSVQLTDAGSYCVVVSNAAGSATSDIATLTVNAAGSAPIFTTQPASQTVTAGASVTFAAAASGSPTPTYQWQKNGANISGATSASYAIASVATTDAGTYTVVATNSAGSATSNGAILTVNPAGSAPVFTTQPTSRTVTAGNSTTFTAAASGSPTPTYQWRKNAANISGATSASYTISSVAAGDAGTYTVVATNSVGSATSNGAVLTVNVAPTITTQPVSQTVVVGASVTFTVVASGTPAPTYQWRKGNSGISGATSASYTIASVTTSSAGTYTVRVTNSAGSVTSAGAVLTVTTAVAPSFTTQPASQTVMAGASVTFTAVASGTPAPIYQWRKDGVNISGATSASYTIASAAPADAGTYTIVATNSAGSATSNGATLSVNNATLIAPCDLNGDGQNDILWRNAISGQIIVWFMDGPNLVSCASLGAVSTDWQIAGVGDFNGDGQNDILWRNAISGQIVVWFMIGPNLDSCVSLGTIPTEWQIVN